MTDATINISGLQTGAPLPELAVAIVAIVLIFGTPFLIVLTILIYKARQTRRLHDTVLKFVEKGLPVPPELMLPPPRTSNDLRRGVLLVAVGLGVIGFFLTLPDAPWALGLIPLLIGVGYLVTWKLERRSPE